MDDAPQIKPKFSLNISDSPRLSFKISPAQHLPPPATHETTHETARETVQHNISQSFISSTHGTICHSPQLSCQPVVSQCVTPLTPSPSMTPIIVPPVVTSPSSAASSSSTEHSALNKNMVLPLSLKQNHNMSQNHNMNNLTPLMVSPLPPRSPPHDVSPLHGKFSTIWESFSSSTDNSNLMQNSTSTKTAGYNSTKISVENSKNHSKNGINHNVNKPIHNSKVSLNPLKHISFKYNPAQSHYTDKFWGGHQDNSHSWGNTKTPTPSQHHLLDDPLTSEGENINFLLGYQENINPSEHSNAASDSGPGFISHSNINQLNPTPVSYQVPSSMLLSHLTPPPVSLTMESVSCGSSENLFSADTPPSHRYCEPSSRDLQCVSRGLENVSRDIESLSRDVQRDLIVPQDCR